MTHRIRTFLTLSLVVSLSLAGFSARAGMIGTEQLLAAEARASDLARVQDFLAREDVRAQLEAWDVPAALATERVAALSDAELQTLVQNLDAEPAGGDAIGVIGVVFLVLLILELVGVTDIFKAI